jgi:hypothetical protein
VPTQTNLQHRQDPKTAISQQNKQMMKEKARIPGRHLAVLDHCSLVEAAQATVYKRGYQRDHRLNSFHLQEIR